jgi:arylsulfatase A-like enzyme
MENYASLAEDADARVGWLLESLSALDRTLLADTIVIVLGDNGTPDGVLEDFRLPAGERTRAGKGTGYEGGVQIPLVLARGCDWLDAADGTLDGFEGTDPACTATTIDLASPGLVVEAPTQVEDLYATIATLAGSTAALPEASADLSPCLATTDAVGCGVGLDSRAIYAERFSRPYASGTGYGTTGAATAGEAGYKLGDAKLVLRVDADAAGTCVDYEFYDLANDPNETDDLRTGGLMSRAQTISWMAAWVSFRTDIAPDWLPSRNCAPGTPWDTDGDLYEDAARGGSDCNDRNARINPGAREQSGDGIDSNCNGVERL